MSNIFFIVLCMFALEICDSRTAVVVTGAGGRSGSLLMKKLISRSDLFHTTGIVRTEKSRRKLFKFLDPTLKNAPVASQTNIKVVDVTSVDALASAFQGADKVILCTSAVPKIKPLSILKVLLLKLIRRQGRPEFKFSPGQDPYNVDWLGAKNQIDAAKAAGVKHFVFLSSMGGTQPENFLNTIGKIEGDDKSGNILLWKRMAEEYLIKSGMTYTIIHPGGLTDKPGGEKEIIFDVDDNLLQKTSRQIPRQDVAEVCLQSILQPGAANRSFDIIASPDARKPTSDWKAFFANPGNCKY